MAGNVTEWVADRFGPDNPRDQLNPPGPSTGLGRRLRGGCWRTSAAEVRLSSRSYVNLRSRLPVVGFRVAISPRGEDDPDLLFERGLRLLAKGKFAGAERAFRALLRQAPRDEAAHYNLACTYSRWGRPDAALTHLRRAVTLGFTDPGQAAKDPDLKSLRADPRFKTILEGGVR
jgi:tetratricopeptide (TPR) repeat protein